MLNHRLQYLLKKYYNKSATAEEREELMAALQDDSQDESIRSILLALMYGPQDQAYSLDEDKANRILKQIFEQDSGPESDEFATELTSGLDRVGIWGSFRYWAAAMVVIAATLATYVMLNENVLPSLFHADITKEQTVADFLPGGDKAILTLWDGTVINLENVDQAVLKENIKIDSEKGELTYKGIDSQMGYNLLTTPLGGQYKVLLPDGSSAWLNAGSSLRFPTSFVGNERIVEVTGEVFFDVSPRKEKPFVVRLNHPGLKKEALEVVVLGTQFNVSSYSDDPAVQTTLVRGSVKVRKGQDVKILVPGEQAEIRGKEGVESKIEVKTVDAEIVTAWKAGMFEFAGDSLEGIMRQIARWYNVEIEYEGDVSSKHFYGAISRKEQASEVLKILEMTGGVKFEINGNKIKVKAV